MAQTLWERLVYGVPKPELEVYNPLKAKVGARFTLDLIEYRGHPPLVLTGLTEYTRMMGLSCHKFCDYLLKGHKDVRLRLVPEGAAFRSLLLAEDGVEQWNEQLHQALTDNTGRFEITQDGKTDVFFRLNGLADPYTCVIKEMIDLDGDKVIQESEVTERRLEYWDFHREVKDVAGQSSAQLLFVELDDHTKQFTFLVGQEVDADRVQLL